MLVQLFETKSLYQMNLDSRVSQHLIASAREDEVQAHMRSGPTLELGSMPYLPPPRPLSPKRWPSAPGKARRKLAAACVAQAASASSRASQSTLTSQGRVASKAKATRTREPRR